MLNAATATRGRAGPGWRSEATFIVASREYGRETLEVWSAEEDGERLWLARSPNTRLVAERATPLGEELCEDLHSLVR